MCFPYCICTTLIIYIVVNACLHANAHITHLVVVTCLIGQWALAMSVCVEIKPSRLNKLLSSHLVECVCVLCVWMVLMLQGLYTKHRWVRLFHTKIANQHDPELQRGESLFVWLFQVFLIRLEPLEILHVVLEGKDPYCSFSAPVSSHQTRTDQPV